MAESKKVLQDVQGDGRVIALFPFVGLYIVWPGALYILEKG
jgi:hypothetical protein